MISAIEADLLAQRAHRNDRNNAGLLFIDHVRRVAARLRDEPDVYAVPAALLHDSVEKARSAGPTCVPPVLTLD